MRSRFALWRTSLIGFLSVHFSDGGYQCSQFYGGDLSDGEALRINSVEGDGLVVVEQGSDLIADIAVKVPHPHIFQMESPSISPVLARCSSAFSPTQFRA